MGKPKRVGLYLRVSTTGQTVENQRQDLERVAEQRGWEITETYVDHGISGAKGRDKRPAFDRLCTDASRGKLDVVSAWSIDRLGRSLANVATFLVQMQEQRDAELQARAPAPVLPGERFLQRSQAAPTEPPAAGDAPPPVTEPALPPPLAEQAPGAPQPEIGYATTQNNYQKHPAPKPEQED